MAKLTKKKSGLLILLALGLGAVMLAGGSSSSALATATPVTVPPNATPAPTPQDLLTLLQDTYPTPPHMPWLNLPVALYALGTVESRCKPGAQGDFVNGKANSLGIWQVSQPTWARVAGPYPIGASVEQEIAYIKPLVDDLVKTLRATHSTRPDIDVALMSSLIWEFGSTVVKSWFRATNGTMTADSFADYFKQNNGKDVSFFYPQGRAGYDGRQSLMSSSYNSGETMSKAA